MADFSYGGYAVPGISEGSAFPRLGAEALAPEQLVGTYDGAPLPELPAALRAAGDAYLADLVRRAEAEGKTCDNNLSYSLARVDVTRPEVNGRRVVVFKLKFRPTDYFHFQFPNNALDVPIEVGGARTTARAALGLAPERQSLEELDPAPCHFKVGTGTVLVCAPERAGAPERVVVSVRSRRQLMVGGKEGPKYHLSAAEGMLRPADGPGGAPSPFRTAERSLYEELGLRAGTDFDPAALRCLGLYLDTARAQPFFLMFARVPLSFPEVRARWQVAPHRHENVKLVGPEWEQLTAHRLLVGSFDDDDGSTYDVASNHAQLGFLMAAAHEDELRRARGARFVFGG